MSKPNLSPKLPEVPHPAKSLPILQLGHPRLNEATQFVEDPTHPYVQWVVDSLFATVDNLGSPRKAAISAPQIDIPLRIALFGVPPGRGDAEVIPLTPLINPVILEKSPETLLAWERCLSFPDLTGEVCRHQHITYRYQNLEGETITRKASNFHARVIQHELDHLDGILYTQRMPDITRFGYVDEIQAQVVK